MENVKIQIVSDKAYLLDLNDLKAFLGGVSRRTLLRMNDEGEIKLYKMRGRLYAKRDEVIQNLENGLLEPVL